jgi:hypothetical protein
MSAAAKITVTGALVLAALGLAGAWHEHAAAERAELALAQAQLDLLKSRHAADAAAADARRRAAQAARPGGAAGADGAASGAARSGNSGLAALLQLMGNPAMQKQMGAMAALRIDGQFGPLFKALNLNSDQIAQFKNLMEEKEMVGFDTMAAAQQQGIDPKTDPRGFFQAMAEAEKSVDGQISSLLGNQGFEQFQQYLGSLPARNTALVLTQSLSYTATPLSDSQSAQVIDILTHDGTPALPPTNPFAVLNGDLGVIKLNDQGQSQLQATLAPAQLQALKETIQEHQQLLQARQQMSAR